MKKFNFLCYVVGVVCFLIAIYIIYDKFSVDDNSINFNEEEELVLFNDRLSEVSYPMGWIVIVDGISNQDSNGSYKLSFGDNLFDNYSYRQLVTMEYILSYNNYSDFIVLDMDGNVVEDAPTDEFTLAYLEYDNFNNYYKSLFGENFDINKAMKGNTSYDGKYVYYDNRRAGSNGVYVSMMEASSIEYDDEVYTASVNVTYSTRASELVGVSEDTASIEYIKDINGEIHFTSFVIEER